MSVKRYTYKKFVQKMVCLSVCSLFSAQAMNLLRPHDALIRPEYYPDKTWTGALFAEHGFKAKAYNSGGSLVNPLQVWQATQNSLAMLEGFGQDQAVNDVLTCLDGAQDDGTRGHIAMTGDMFLDSGALFARYHFYDNWYLTTYLPFYRMKLTNFCWRDLTLDETVSDARVKSCLTDNLANNVYELGGLELCNWTRTGLGDATMLIEWLHNFKQAKPFLKNVRLNWRLGLTIPTGKREDINKILAFPLGYDGGMCVLFGGGIDLTLGSFFKAGADVELLHEFGNERTRRIKTNINQTDILLLQTLPAYKDYGLTQKFDLYVQFYQVLGGLSGKFGYQFLKRGDDRIVLCSQQYSHEIADSACSLWDWTLHQAVINISYDISRHFDDDATVKPYVSLFSRIPFNGKRSVAFPTLGAVFSLAF